MRYNVFSKREKVFLVCSLIFTGIMNFRAPLFVSDDIDYDVFSLLTDAQKSKLLNWALVLDVTVKDMLRDAKFMCEQINEKSHEVYLFGMLPNCKLYGCISPDGSSHT